MWIHNKTKCHWLHNCLHCNIHYTNTIQVYTYCNEN